MSESDEVPFVYIYLRILSQTTKQTISLIESQKHPIGVWQRSSRHSKRWSRCRVRGRRDGLRCGALGSANAAVRTQKRKKTKERTKYEIQFVTEANLTPRNIAPFCHAGRWRLAGAPRLRSRRCATSAVGGRPAREYARQVQRRSPG